MSLESFENSRQDVIASVGTWTIKPDVLSEYLVGQGLTADQAQGVVIVEGDPLSTTDANVPPAENIMGTIWINPQGANENYLARMHAEFSRSDSIGEEVELLSEKEVNLAVLEAAQFAARVAKGEKIIPSPSKLRLAINAATGAAAAALAAVVYEPTGADVLDKLITERFFGKVFEYTGGVANKIEDKRSRKKRASAVDVPRFVELTPAARHFDYFEHKFQEPNALATYIGGHPQDEMEKNKRHKRALDIIEADHPIREYTEALAMNLGLEADRDILLLSEYLAIRGIKSEIYDAAFAQRMPIIRLFAEDSEQVLERKRMALAKIEQSVEKIIGEEYITEEEKRYARTLGLAVGDLIVRSSDSTGIETKVHITSEILQAWSERWKPQFEKDVA